MVNNSSEEFNKERRVRQGCIPYEAHDGIEEAMTINNITTNNFSISIIMLADSPKGLGQLIDRVAVACEIYEMKLTSALMNSFFRNIS